MSDLPPGWAEAALGRVCRRIVDGSHNPPPASEAGLPMLSARNIEGEKIVFEAGHRLIALGAFEFEHRRTQIEPGNVLLTIVGAIGRVAVVRPEHGAFALQRSVAVCEVEPSVLPDFLSKYFMAPAIQQWLQDHAKGTAQRGIYLSTLSTMPIAVPPMAEQRRIVAKIDALTARSKRARAELFKTRNLCARTRDAVLESLASEPNEINGWRRHPVGQIATSFDGPFGSHLKGSDYVETGVRVVRLENVGRLRFIEEKRTYVSAEKGEALLRHALAADDVLVSSFMDDGVRVPSCRLSRAKRSTRPTCSA